MMTASLDAVLEHWRFQGAAVGQMIERENRIFPVEHSGRKFALRLHRPGYRTLNQLRSELGWMAMLAARGLKVPTPEPDPEGNLIARIDGVLTSVLHWVPGRRTGTTGEGPDVADRPGTFRALGAAMASMHEAADAWTAPPGFTRPAWDREGLLGEAPLWGRFWEAHFLGDADRAYLSAFRDRAEADLTGLTDLDHGLIHADLLGENVLVGDAGLYVIDFDDGGWGYRLFDVATSLVKLRGQPDFAELRAALLEGFRSVRAIDTSALPLFMALRACTYLGWLADRWTLPEARTRADRNIAAARHFIDAYTEQR